MAAHVTFLVYGTSVPLCSTLGSLLQVTYYTSFALTAFFAADNWARLAIDTRERTARVRRACSSGRRAWLFPFLAWAIGLALATASGFARFYDHLNLNPESANSWCLLNPEVFRTARYVLVSIPLALTITLVSGFWLRFYFAFVGFAESYGSGDRQSFKKVRRNLLSYIGIFVACWLPSLVSATVSYFALDFATSNSRTAVATMSTLFLVQGLLAPAQGLLNAVVYGFSVPAWRLRCALACGRRCPCFGLDPNDVDEDQRVNESGPLLATTETSLYATRLSSSTNVRIGT